MARISSAEREELVQKRRDEIVAGALSLWMEEGFDKSSVADIACRAGVAKGTVYLYFETKEEILTEVFRRYSMLPDLRGVVARVADRELEEVIPLLVGALWSGLVARAPAVQLLFRELVVRPEQARRFIEEVVIPTNELFAGALQPFVDRGAMRKVDLLVASRALAGTLVAFLFTQVLLGGNEVRPVDDATIVDTVSDLFLRGVLPRGAV